jgi:hypothetical protein
MELEPTATKPLVDVDDNKVESPIATLFDPDVFV